VKPLASRAPSSSSLLGFFPIAALVFGAFGALLVLIGTSQDELARGLHLDLARTGLLASSLVLGIGAGVIVAGPLVDRMDRRALFAGSLLLTSAALATVDSTMSFSRALAHVVLAGVGGGIYETVLNTETIERYRERSVRMLTLLHSATTIGAMAAPLALNAFTEAGLMDDWATAFHAVGALHGALFLLALATPFTAPVRSRTGAGNPAASQGRAGDASTNAPVFTPALAALCVAAFAYIGVESAITAFAIPYAVDGLALGPERGRSAISMFWVGLLAGRVILAWRLAGDTTRIAVAAGLLAGATVLAGVAFSWTALELLVASVGFCLGGVFPLLVALAGQRTPHATGTAVAVVAGLGSLGGFLVPWLTGVLGDIGGIALGIGALSGWCVLIALAAATADHLHRRRSEIS
jgi:DHA1 family bicyclomycin/chloramphenicol resistance-like MFS transporter